MKYAFLVYGEETKIGAMADDECMEFDAAVRRNGKCTASEALQRVSTAKIVKVRDGKLSVIDGPFAETKEQLVGFYVIDAPDVESAIELAAKIPPARVGRIEIRPVRELVSTQGDRRLIP